jgi:acyl-CoA reductase-like NAD-dependent aldehyde dehydrogenase
MLVEHPGIDKIAFTGDTSTGKGIMKGSADTLKKITLELGGKSPNIVFADADLDARIRGATTGIFYGKGEVCAAGSRLLVDKSIKSEFIDKVAAPREEDGARRSARSEDAARRDLVEEAARDDLRYIEIAKQEGATLVAGGAARTSAPARATSCSRRCSTASRRR